MRYTVHGADSSTGQDKALTFDTTSEQAAEKIARMGGLLVESVVAEPPSHPVVAAPLRARRSAAPAGLYWSVAIVVMVLLVAAVLSLQSRLADSQKRLKDLTAEVNHNAAIVSELAATVNHNAEAANKNTEHVASAVTSLTETVNRNAEAANKSADRLASALDSLTETVNHNARVANSNLR